MVLKEMSAREFLEKNTEYLKYPALQRELRLIHEPLGKFDALIAYDVILIVVLLGLVLETKFATFFITELLKIRGTRIGIMLSTALCAGLFGDCVIHIVLNTYKAQFIQDFKSDPYYILKTRDLFISLLGLVLILCINTVYRISKWKQKLTSEMSKQRKEKNN